MDKTTKEIINKYSPMWTVKETADYEKKYGELIYDIKFVQSDDLTSVWGDKKMESYGVTLRESWNQMYDLLSDEYEMWIKDTPKFENDPPSITDDHIRHVLSMVVEDMVIDGEPDLLKFRIVNGALVIALNMDKNQTFRDVKELYEEFYHLATDYNETPEDADDDYYERMQNEFDKRMKEKLDDKYISGNKEKLD